eukprot:5708835-Heterocapsa_arctica.AAC.1
MSVERALCLVPPSGVPHKGPCECRSDRLAVSDAEMGLCGVVDSGASSSSSSVALCKGSPDQTPGEAVSGALSSSA